MPVVTPQSRHRARGQTHRACPEASNARARGRGGSKKVTVGVRDGDMVLVACNGDFGRPSLSPHAPGFVVPPPKPSQVAFVATPCQARCGPPTWGTQITVTGHLDVYNDPPARVHWPADA